MSLVPTSLNTIPPAPTSGLITHDYPTLQITDELLFNIWQLMSVTKEYPLPLPVSRALEKLGRDISFARRRRQMPQAMLAERIGVSVMTVRRMEAGSPNIALQTLARALHVFGELERLKQLLDSSEDSIGLALMDEKLPQRVRLPKARKDSGAL